MLVHVKCQSITMVIDVEMEDFMMFIEQAFKVEVSVINSYYLNY